MFLTLEDETAKSFWSKQFPTLILKFAAQAEKTEEGSTQRAESFKTEYLEMVDLLMKDHDNFLSVRILLQLNEQLLQKHGFIDVWRSQKQIENSLALSKLHVRLKEVDEIEAGLNERINRRRWEELFRGVLAGNIFDSGATAVQDILSENEHFGLQDALKKIQERPWLIDCFDDFMKRLENGPHTCATFFCDNSGVDIVLGVIPFVRELLRNNTTVILVANSEPSLNDVTYPELVAIIEETAEICPIVKDNYVSNNLVLRESGQKCCCLNFLNIDETLVDTMLQYNSDLIIIEGMGRSLHTNLNSRFKCDSLKLAVIKNKFLASRLGGNLFDAICKYEC